MEPRGSYRELNYLREEGEERCNLSAAVGGKGEPHRGQAMILIMLPKKVKAMQIKRGRSERRNHRLGKRDVSDLCPFRS